MNFARLSRNWGGRVFVRAYRAQLELYAKAIDKRFAPRRVTYKGIYSLELGELIEV